MRCPGSDCVLNRLRPKSVYGPLLGAILAVAPYAVFLLPNDHVIASGDYTNYQLPAREFARDEIFAGRLPLWCQYLCCGTPMHATQQAGFAYLPVTAAVLLLGANAGLKFNVFLHVLFCYVGQYKLTRLFGVSRPASVFAAIVACQSGFLVYHLLEGHLTLVLEYALIPWFFWAVVSFLRRPRAKTAVILALLVAMLAIGGQPQLLYYCLLIGGLWGVGSVWWGDASRHRVSAVAWGLAGALVAILLSAIQTVPTWELMKDGYLSSERGSLEYASGHAAMSIDALSFWCPYFMGSRLAEIPEYAHPGGYFHERTNYLGLAVPLLALLGLAKSVERWQWLMAGLVVFCLLIAVGPATPLFGALGAVVPGLFSFRCPGRVLAITSILAPVLAAQGLDSWILQRPWESGRRLLAAIALAWFAASILLDSIVSLVDLGEPYVVYVKQTVVPQFIAAAALTLVVVGLILPLPAIGKRSQTLAYLLVIWVTVNDLWITNAQYVRLAPPKPFGELPTAEPADPNVRIVDAPGFPEIIELNLRYSCLVPIAIENSWTSVMTDEGGVEPQSIRRLHEGIVRNTLPALPTAGCNWLWKGGPWQLIEKALPRARFVPEQAKELCEIALTEISAEQVERLHQAATPCSIDSDLGRTLTVSVTAPTDGVVVLADTFYPGWKCRSQGEELEIRSVHGAFRGVSVPAGQHKLVFSYEPWSHLLGFLLTIVGLVIAAAILVYDRRSSRR